MRIVSSGSVKVFYPLYSREELIALLHARVLMLANKLSLHRVVLFGSWAKGRATAFSDVDLMVIYKGPPRDDAWEIVRTVIDLRALEPHIYTEEQAARLETILGRMMDGGVVLFPSSNHDLVVEEGPETR